MIPRSADWKNALSEAIRDPAELLSLLQLPRDLLPAAREAAREFPLRVPRGYLTGMEKGNPDDPLLRQVLPLNDELLSVEGFNADPVGDSQASALPGLLHKYNKRVLLTLTGACAIHCRYCFRRHFPYGDENPGRDNWQGVVDYLTQHPEVEELILSGGDPLMLDTTQLYRLTDKLIPLQQLKRLRIHTRLPVVLPERIDSGLLAWLNTLPWQIIVVIHANHPEELGHGQQIALEQLQQLGVTLLNQSVLLRGINDTTSTLIALSRRLFECNVLPYYLHQLDRVSGASHFEVHEQQSKNLLRSMQDNLPGYLVPRLVREIAGKPCKQTL